MLPRPHTLRLTLALVATLATAIASATGSLDEIIRKAMEGHKTPAVAALTIRAGKIDEQGVQGVRVGGGSDPAQPGDLWHLGSDMKPITATLIVRLVERGYLTWSETLEELLPDLRGTMRPEYREVTLKDLLTHHSGLPANTDGPFFYTFYDKTGHLTEQRLSYISHAFQDPPKVKRGTYNYSNTGFITLAAIAERVTHKPYEELIKEIVFDPLGMTSPVTGLPTNGQPVGHFKGRPAAPEDAENPLMFAPAGAYRMTMEDWAKFCIDAMAGANGQGKILSQKDYQLMQTALPKSTNGLGWGVRDSLSGLPGPVLTHTGSNGAWWAVLVLFPAKQSGILVAANAATDMEADKVTAAVIKELLKKM